MAPDFPGVRVWGDLAMLDLFGILLSSGLMLFIIVRAVQLDRSVPWYQPITRKKNAPKASAGTWRRQPVDGSPGA